ncbi:MAG: type III-A CRISPR-associated RAMP protein Csm4 [Thermosynechococcaceae cyanobacterium]
MSSHRLIRLNFGQNLTHFGETGIGLESTSERVRSDALFSAWMSAYVRIFGKDDLESLLAKFEPDQKQPPAQPPFRLSSTFIYHQRHTAKSSQSEIIDYVPRPLAFPKGYPVTNDLALSKTYRKLHFLPLEIWQRWYQGQGMTSDDIDELAQETLGQSTGSLKQAGTFDYSATFATQQVPKVAIDRTTRATNFYHIGFTRYNAQADDHSGLYFLLQFPEANAELEGCLHAALELLGEEGLGGERSSGAGQFEITEWSDLSQNHLKTLAKNDAKKPSLERWRDVLQFANGNHHSLISLFWQHPFPKDRLGPQAQYALLERGGWIVSQQLRRQMVRMFAEGSVFSEPPHGQLADVTPLQIQKQLAQDNPPPKVHHVYRSGIALSLPIALEVNTP